MKRSSVVFLVNLLQDVSVIRPLVHLARQETDAEILLLLSRRFLDRDRQKIWQRELGQLRVDVGAGLHHYENPLDALAVLQGRHGILIAASESSLSGHADTHDVFRVAPPGFLRVTLQHGLECVGFLQNREHNIAHGRNVTFAADVLCGWCEAPVLTAMPVSERSKLYVTGPTMVLQRKVRGEGHPGIPGGIVCENLHSVRLKATGDHGASFMDVFFAFCAAYRDYGLPVTLRPHPGGQYVLKNNVALPDNVALNNLPIYKADLSSYLFGISAPSTVVLDMVLAGIPTAVWHDAEGIMDYGNYVGLTEISTFDDWLAFARDAVLRPEALLGRQKAFLDRLAMPIEPSDVHRRFARLFATGTAGPALDVPVRREPAETRTPAPRRILFIVNGMIPTLQLSFLKPLAPLEARGEVEIAVIAEQTFGVENRCKYQSPEGARLVAERIRSVDPDVIVCCRYSGPHEQLITDVAAELGIPVVFHVDDDLLNIPIEIGEQKFRSHNRPERLRTVDHLLRNADLVYCSTRPLKRRFRRLGYGGPMVAGDIYCAGRILSPAERRPVTTIGYMGFDHAHDFEIVLPDLIRLLRRNTEVRFELFGSIPLPPSLLPFGDRVTVVEPVRDYEKFLAAFAERRWDIGLCPLATTPFNAVKANTKWVEYTSVGAAVIATKGMVYDDCTADGCGILAEDGDWLDAMEGLIDDPDRRFEMVERAQRRVRETYSPDRLVRQIMAILDTAVEGKRTSNELKEWAPRGSLSARGAEEANLIALYDPVGIRGSTP